MYSSEEFLESSILNLLKCFIASNLSTVLPEVTKSSALLLTIPKTSVSVERSAVKRVRAYPRSTQTGKRLAKLLTTTEMKILRHLELIWLCEGNFH
jgi:hypothetical protein